MLGTKSSKVLLVSTCEPLRALARAGLAEVQLELESVEDEDAAVQRGDFGRYAAILVDASRGASFVDRWARDADARNPICAAVDGPQASRLDPADASAFDDVIVTDWGPAFLAQQVVRAIDFRRMRRSLFDMEKMALLGSVTAGVLHELKNPLNNLLGGMERLLSQVHTDPAVLRWGSMMRRNGEQLRDSLRDLLDGFKSNESHESVDIHVLLERAIHYVLRGDVAYRAIDLEKAFDEDAPLVVGSAGHLLHLFLNLVLNARQAMGNAGRLTVRTRWDGDQAVVEVEDTGPGIPPEVLPSLFRSFLSTKAGGSGLGLVLCQKIAERHHGSLEAENKPAGGALFRVRLPAGRSSDAGPRILA